VEIGNEGFGRMSATSYQLGNIAVGNAIYANHMDFEVWDWKKAYHGLQAHGTENDKFFNTIDRLEAINEEYDTANLLAGIQLF